MYHSQVVPEQVVQMIVADNLDIACSAIEKAAMERAVSDVDEGFAASYEARRRHREVCLFLVSCSSFDIIKHQITASQWPTLLGSISANVELWCKPS